MEIWSIEIDQKYASNNDGTVTTELDNDMVYVATGSVQGNYDCVIMIFEMQLGLFSCHRFE